jgi:hypothetical protein
LQHTLYRAAKADPGRRFHALMDKVYRRDVLWRAWVMVRSNNGAPGIDQTTLAEVEQYGITRLLDELATELREGRYRPLPARRVMIPKPGLKDEYRPTSWPAGAGSRLLGGAGQRLQVGEVGLVQRAQPAGQVRVGGEHALVAGGVARTRTGRLPAAPAPRRLTGSVVAGGGTDSRAVSAALDAAEESGAALLPAAPGGRGTCALDQAKAPGRHRAAAAAGPGGVPCPRPGSRRLASRCRPAPAGLLRSSAGPAGPPA